MISKANCQLVAICAFCAMTKEVTFISYDNYYKKLKKLTPSQRNISNMLLVSVFLSNFVPNMIAISLKSVEFPPY